MLELLRAHDAELVELPCDGGAALISPGLQGRIFCRLGNELIHRLDSKALQCPSPTEFNNLGGNSLWPAPEGGPFAFNYLPGSDRWLVQHGIADAPAHVVAREADSAVVEKRIELCNRKGVCIPLIYRRALTVLHAPLPDGYALTGLRYRAEDSFEPFRTHRAEDVLIAPWSLEQFPGADGIVAFCKVKLPMEAINFDFYGDPGDRIVYRDGHFVFRLGGADRHQIGIAVRALPEFIGAMDPARGMLMLRRTETQEGIYFNIADNDQPGGPYSAADLYSIFNGGELGFFELETIGAMQVVDRCVGKSTLISETTLLKGEESELRRYLAEQLGVVLQVE